jgi:thiosulfate dehydrogenase
MRAFAAGVVLTILAVIAVAYLCLEEGYLSFAADTRPSAAERNLAMSAVDASTDRHAPDVKNPIAPSDDNLATGAKLYLDHCAGCHGVPSNPDSTFARSFYPPVPRFFQNAPDMPENQNFYIIKHGIRWTGMPAWNQTLAPEQIWQLVTFLSHIQKLPPAAQKILGPTEPAQPEPMHVPKQMNMPTHH